MKKSLSRSEMKTIDGGKLVVGGGSGSGNGKCCWYSDPSVCSVCAPYGTQTCPDPNSFFCEC